MLMSLCSKARDNGTEDIVLYFNEIRELTGYKQTSNEKFVSDLERMNNKLMKITCSIKTEKRILMFVLFPTFDIDMDKQTLTVAVNQKFEFILNAIVSGFTRFELAEFIALDSKYTKNLYRLLKQYRTTGIVNKFAKNIDEFKEAMGIPKSYKNRDITSKAIKPAVKELNDKGYFKNLKFEAQKGTGRGNPVIGYVFTFDKETIQQSEEQLAGQMDITDFPEYCPSPAPAKKKPATPKKNSFTGYSNQRTYSKRAEALMDKSNKGIITEEEQKELMELLAKTQ